MKLPHITVEYRDEESLAPGKLSPTFIMGFGLHWAWVFCCPYCLEIFFPSAVQSAPLFYLCSGVSLGLTLLAYGVCFESARQLFSTKQKRQRNRLIGACCSTVGMLFFFIIPLGGIFAPLGALSAGVLTGIGSAVLLMSFGVSSSLCDTATVSTSVALSFLVTSVLFALLTTLNHYVPWAAIICVLLIPALEFLCLQECSAVLTDNYSFAAFTMPVKRRKLALRIGFPSLFFGTLIGMSQQLIFPTGYHEVYDFSYLTCAIIAAGILTCIIVIGAMLTQRQSVNYALRTLSPLVALCFLLIMPATTYGSLAWVVFLTMTAHLLIEAALWICLSDLSQRYRISAFPLFGFSRAVIALGAMLSYALLYLVQEWHVDEMLGSSNPIIPIALFLLIFGVAAIPQDAEMRRCLKYGKNCIGFYQHAILEGLGCHIPEDQVVQANQDKNEATASEETARQGALTEQGVITGASQGVATVASQDERVPEAQGESASTAQQVSSTTAIQGASAAQSAVAAQGAPAAQNVSSAESFSATQGGSTLQAAPMKPGANATRFPQNAGSGQNQPVVSTVSPSPARNSAASNNAENASPERTKVFQRKCTVIANTYLLSRRETEVLFLLAKGFSGSMIQEKLFISEGTANTHLRHVYRKLNVHSQQELVRMVDAVELE